MSPTAARLEDYSSAEAVVVAVVVVAAAQSGYRQSRPRHWCFPRHRRMRRRAPQRRRKPLAAWLMFSFSDAWRRSDAAAAQDDLTTVEGGQRVGISIASRGPLVDIGIAQVDHAASK